MSIPPQRMSTDSLGSPLSSPRLVQHPLPRADNARRPGSRGKNQTHARRPSAASSINSIGGALNTSSQGSSISEVGQNAISTLLQPPIVRTGLLPHTAPSASTAYRAPSARDIPPVTLSQIKPVDASAFQSYLSQVGSLYEAFQRAKEETNEGNSQLFRRNKDGRRRDSLGAGVLEKGLQGPSLRNPPSHIRKGSITSLVTSPTETSPQPRRISGGLGRRPGHVMTPLSTVPNVYFDQDFHLENPRTFDVVSERSDVVPPVVVASPVEVMARANGAVTASGASGRKALATNAILQEKLSWYLDTVEVHLISSISTASTSFFAALGSLRELHSEASESVDRIKRLRKDLQALDQDMALGGLKIISMRRRRENLRQLGEAVDQLRSIVEEVTRCEGLVSDGKTDVAIDAIEALERMMAGEEPLGPAVGEHPRPKLRDLRGTKALDGAANSIDLLRLRIGKAFEVRFLEVLLGDLRQHVNDVPPSDTLQRWGAAAMRSRGDHARKPSVFPAYLTLDDKLRSELLAILRGLTRSNYTLPATTTYRDAILKEIKSLIRRHLPSSNDDDAESMASISTRGGRALNQQEKSSILARNLRDLSPEDAEELLSRVYSGLGEALRRLGVQVKVLLDVTSGIGSPGIRSPAMSPDPSSLDGYLAAGGDTRLQQDMHQALDMSSLLGQAVDIAQAQITKILKVRSEQTTHLPLGKFLRYFTINRLFADECEAVSGRGGTNLKTIVNTQIKAFVAQLGDAERQQLAQTMDSDLWDAKDFGDVESQLLIRVAEGSTRDAESWTKMQHVWEAEPAPPTRTNGNPSSATATVNGTASTTRDKARSATLDGQSYILPTSAVTVLRGLEAFEMLITHIPSMAGDVAASILEYLKLFNSRSCQLILGAGATKSAGLKNITTKHLALASQSLSFIIALIPHLREFVRRHSPSSAASSGGNSALAEFDKVKRLYQEHQSGIHDKLVEIMSGRATTHVAAMKKIAWNSLADDNDDDGGGGAKTAAASPYMETLTKETSTLHRVLSKHLPAPTVQMIMIPVFTSYREQWGKAFADVPLGSAVGKERMLRDAEHFKARLSKIEGAGDVGDYIVGVVRNKHVEGGEQGSRAKKSDEIPNPAATTAVDEKKKEESSKDGEAASSGDAAAAPK